MSFAEFKNNTEKVFKEIIDVTQRVIGLYKSCNENAILKDKCKQDLIIKMEIIRKDLDIHLLKIGRRQMKCVFFGQTSNGKSAMINAILGQEVLPSSDGRTTSCFITIDSCEEDPYFIIDGQRENDIDKLIDVANEICDKHLTIKSHIQLFWPSYQCNLLNENVQLLDSPGVDYSKDNDAWIEKFCLDSDIFVYVVNGTATINESERGFFRKVTSFIKNPNIIVVMNKWDLCDIPRNEKRIERIKQQHIDTVKNFLSDDLKLKCDSRKKTFFLSAKERLENIGKNSHADNKVAKRMKEFEIFYQTLLDEMTKNAIINKFGPHLDKGNEYLSDIEELLKQFQNVTKYDLPQKNKERNELIKEIKILITNIFDSIMEDGEQEIKKQCPTLANMIMSEESGMSSFVREKIVQSLQEIFIENIEKLRSKMKDLFLSCSEFQLTDEILNNYLPDSFKQHVTNLGKALSSSINKGESKVQNDYNIKAVEIKKEIANHGFISKCGQAAGMAALPLMTVHPITAAMTMFFSSIIDKSSSNAAEAKKNETRDNLRKNAEEFLMKYMKDSYRESQDGIEKSVNEYVNRFSDDHEGARGLIMKLNDLGQKCEEILEDIQLEQIKITTIA